VEQAPGRSSDSSFIDNVQEEIEASDHWYKERNNQVYVEVFLEFQCCGECFANVSEVNNYVA